MPRKKQPSEVMKTDNLVKYDNKIISLYQQATRAQAKFIAYALAKIRMDDAEILSFETTYAEACAVAGIDRAFSIAEIKAFCDTMRKVGVVVDKGADAFDMMTILPTFQYASGRLRISVNPDLKPYLLELKRGESTSYRLEIIRAMKSEYSIKLFEYFKNLYSQPGGKADFYEFEPMQFRERFLDKKEYRSKNYIAHIEERVIKPAIDEINTYSDLSMTYAKVRRGRGVLFVFTVDKNDTPWWVRAEKSAAKKNLPRSSDVALLRADPRKYLIENLRKKTSMAAELFENLIVEFSENGIIIIQGESVFIRRLRELHQDDLSIIAKPHPIEYRDFAELPL